MINEELFLAYVENIYEVEFSSKEEIKNNLKNVYEKVLEKCSYEIHNNLVYICKQNQQYVFSEKYLYFLKEYYKLKSFEELLTKWTNKEIELNYQWF